MVAQLAFLRCATSERCVRDRTGWHIPALVESEVVDLRVESAWENLYAEHFVRRYATNRLLPSVPRLPIPRPSPRDDAASDTGQPQPTPTAEAFAAQFAVACPPLPPRWSLRSQADLAIDGLDEATVGEALHTIEGQVATRAAELVRRRDYRSSGVEIASIGIEGTCDRDGERSVDGCNLHAASNGHDPG